MSPEPCPEMAPQVVAAFAALRADAPAPDGGAMAMARAAMHRERVTRGDLRGSGAVAPAWPRLRDALTPRRLALTGGGAVAALAVVVALGWNAPAGSALHAVRVAREQVALAVPGADRAGLELSNAEVRLRDAADGTAVAASLDEAARLLADARDHLPEDRSSALWSRWRNDDAQLEALRAEHDTGHGDGSAAPDTIDGGGASSSDGSGSGGSDSGGVGGPGAVPSGSGSTASGEAHSSTSTSASSSGGGDHSSTSTSASSSTSTGGGGSSSSSSSSSDHGGSSTSSSSTSSSDSSGH